MNERVSTLLLYDMTIDFRSIAAVSNLCTQSSSALWQITYNANTINTSIIMNGCIKRNYLPWQSNCGAAIRREIGKKKKRFIQCYSRYYQPMANLMCSYSLIIRFCFCLNSILVKLNMTGRFFDVTNAHE